MIKVAAASAPFIPGDERLRFSVGVVGSGSLSPDPLRVGIAVVSWVCAIVAIYLFFFILGALSIFRSLPFALALGVGRRSYYAGTAL